MTTTSNQRQLRRNKWNIGTRSLLICLAVHLFSWPVASRAAEEIKTEIGIKEAWTGEAVPLYVTLYAPGPFSGAASFDLPEVSLTAITTTGSPVVGSEDIEGETFYTQRHTFKVYTQRSGQVTIPSFKVRFESRKDIGADATPINASSTAVSFISKRPPGTAGAGIVVAAENLTVKQSWTPDDPKSMQPGDVLQRRVTISAVGTTAMMLPQAETSPQDGIRTYAGNPEVQDKTQRGETSSQRTDTLKYQFEMPGSYELPKLEIIWWDTDSGELKTASIPGRAVDVIGPPAAPTSELSQTIESPRSWRWLLTGLFVTGFLWIFRSRIASTYRHYHGLRNTPEATAARNVIKACRLNDPQSAYTAVLQWNLNSDFDLSQTDNPALNAEMQTLAAHLYATNASQASWNGSSLMNIFTQVRHSRMYETGTRRQVPVPALNPTDDC